MQMKNDNPKVDLNCKNKSSKCHGIAPLQQHKEYMNKCNKGIWISSLLHHREYMNDLMILPLMKQLNNLWNKAPPRQKEKEAVLKCQGFMVERILNEYNQPVGPTKEEKYDILDEAKPWVFESVCIAWRKYKSQLKTTHFTAYENDELRMENRPVDILKFYFKDILKYWNSDPHKKMFETNTENRNKLKCPHTAGRTHFALIREEKKEISDTSDTVSSKDIFVAT
ncbi:uncharacterized protein LOC107784235 isoform X3 [Nicotiana tabacum]|uniref:Uncharacterized protein isoform X3 n=2 Tax=Nicotiana tabacum TaxID=4097 RepID=A0A1S3Z8X4_TOBAC|nr:PREDICTED: uncharacterized protein LOC107784235 isoform X3 [Nicotiana tabacum]